MKKHCKNNLLIGSVISFQETFNSYINTEEIYIVIYSL